MEVIIFLGIIAFFILFIFINVKISKFKYRAGQQILKGSGASSSEINSTITSAFEEKNIQKIIQNHPDFSKEQILNLLKMYSENLINTQENNQFRMQVIEKMKDDKKLEKFKYMQYVRTNIISYSNDKMNAVVIYSDGKDEYNIYFECIILNEKIEITNYRTSKGEVLGF